MRVLLLTDEDGFESSVPTLALLSSSVRRAPLTAADGFYGADVAVIDARINVAVARDTCRRLAVTVPSLAVVAALAAENLAAVDLDWHLDDVLLPTTDATELYTRLRLAIARRRQAVEGTLRFGDLILHPQSYTATLADRKLELTLTEFKLLNYLVRHAGHVATRNRLMREIWGRECSRRTIDVNIQRLRAKLGAEHESLVSTVRGVGYMAGPIPPRWAATAPPEIDARLDDETMAEVVELAR